MDLKVASMSEINDELERRKMLSREASIKKLFEDICIAYNTGKISMIKTETRNAGTSAEVMTYFVHIK